MIESRLESRSWWIVALSYFIAPAVALTALWLYLVFPTFLLPPSAEVETAKALQVWGLLLVIGTPVCLLVELLVATPLLIGFRRYQWRWLNGWSAAAIGFATGGLLWLAVGIWPPPDPGQTYIVGSVPLVVDGERTWAGWHRIIRDAVMMGIVGLIAASIFRLLAVRHRP